MRRREFIAGLGGAVAWPVAGRAQQPAMPVVGYIATGVPGPWNEAAFRQGLKEAGFVEGQNVTVEYRYGLNQPDRVRDLTADLVRRNVAAIASLGGTVTARIVKAATSTIPIIFEVGYDPVEAGLVASLSRPGGNLTGVNSIIGELWTKRIDLMAKLLPSSRIFGLLITAQIDVERQPRLTSPAADALRKLVFATALTSQELDAAFAALARQGAEALIIGASPLSIAERDQLAALAARYSLPAIYAFREIPKAGGLISYGIDISESARLIGLYTGRILRGEKPADLPIVQPTRFVLTINLKTAKALGVTIPPNLLAVADEVIE